MPDDDAFLRAIIDNPDDDLPRLVYADWLDEHGDSERAEFIRVQCELERTCHEGDTPARKRLRRRERELRELHENEWLGPFVEFVQDPLFQRGFVSGFMVNAAGLLAHADRLWRLAPISWIDLRDAWEVADKLAGCPHLGRIKSLGISLNQLGDSEANAVFSSPYFGQLESLYAGNNQFGLSGVQALAANPALTSLRVLTLSQNDIGSVGAIALAESPYLVGLRELDLSKCSVGPRGVEALAAGSFRNLESLDLNGNYLAGQGIRNLIFSHPPARMRRLGLAGIDLTDSERAALKNRFGPGVCVFD